MKKAVLVLLCTLLALLPLAACGSSASSSAAPASSAPVSSAPEETAPAAYATTLADIQANGELIIGLDDTFAPMGYRDESGELVGFDIDLATAVCEELGVTATFQPIDWNAKEMELATGNIDCIWNGMSINPERMEGMALSQAYMNNKMIVMTNDGVEIASKADLANYNVGVQAASGALEAMINDPDYDLYADKVTEYPTYDEVILAMQSGREDCMVIDEMFGNYKNTQLEKPFNVVTAFDFGDDLYAVGFRKGDTELRDAVNDALNSLIDAGTAVEISKVWFNENLVLDADTAAADLAELEAGWAEELEEDTAASGSEAASESAAPSETLSASASAA